MFEYLNLFFLHVDKMQYFLYKYGLLFCIKKDLDNKPNNSQEKDLAMSLWMLNERNIKST